MSDCKTIVIPDKCSQIALCGESYGNFGEVSAFLKATEKILYRFCPHNIGEFSPCPDRVLDLLRSASVIRF